jgi:hypothetical protein
MTQQRRFDLIYASATKQHLAAIERKYHSLIRNKIETQLRFEPTVETENRKPLVQPAAFEAEWEIRFGRKNQFRVFYEVN